VHHPIASLQWLLQAEKAAHLGLIIMFTPKKVQDKLFTVLCFQYFEKHIFDNIKKKFVLLYTVNIAAFFFQLVLHLSNPMFFLSIILF